MNSKFAPTQKVVEHAIAAQASASKAVDDGANWTANLYYQNMTSWS